MRRPAKAGGAPVTVELYQGDLPAGFVGAPVIAIDSETLGLNPQRDRLCVVQLSIGDGNAHVIHFPTAADGGADYAAPNLKALLADPATTKLFHFGRFDLAVIRRYLGVACVPARCTKIASKLARTYTDRHGLKDLCRELLGVDLDTGQQSSDWGAAELTAEQVRYAGADVLYLHRLWERLDEMLVREGRREFAEACFAFLPARAELDLAGWASIDIFEH
jgi:ribonuclease D